MDAIQEEVQQVQPEESSEWEVFSDEDESETFSEQSEEGTDESSGDEELQPRKRRSTAIS